MKAPQAMIAAVKSVSPSNRLAAARLAEKTYFDYLDKLTMFGDFNHSTNMEMAADAAAAEVKYFFS